LLLFLLTATAGSAWQGKCVGVTDGDKISVMHGGRAERIRLNGIDCPESRQAFGTQARQATAKWVFGTVVTVVPVDTDHYGRTVAKVWCANGASLNESLLRSGYAWWYRQYAPHSQLLASLEQQARQAKRGLWADAHAQPPWEFRHGTSFTTAGSSGRTTATGQSGRTRSSSASAATVYVTRTGRCFHRVGCSSLRKSQSPMSRQAAMATGLRACSRCNP
jgi:endonuclease YncB( thermonuclease family)